MTSRIALLIVLLLAAGPPAQAQSEATPPVADAGLQSASRSEIVHRFAKAMRDRYIFPEIGDAVAARIERGLTAGEYDKAADGSALARHLSEDAAAIAHDKHLKLLAPRRGTMLRHGATAIAAQDGVSRADRLAGNVGYIEIISFPPAADFKRSIDVAMMSLRGSKTLILDLRRNGGGEPDGVAYLVSFLVERGLHINDIVTRIGGTTEFTREAIRTSKTPISFRRARVMVLTSADTFSGGEELAYDLQALKRALVIGETTGGGANPVDTIGLGHGVIASIPCQRAENPVTRTNWEGTGVKPDIPVAAAEALRVALKHIGHKPVDFIDAAIARQVFKPR